jgi:hypothetical protein
MGRVEQRLEELGLELPAEPKLPPGVTILFQWVRVRDNRAFVSGHGALAADSSPLGPFGKVPSQVPLGDAQASARAATLAVLASLKRTIGELDRIVAWLMIYGSINADPGYAQTRLVVNPALRHRQMSPAHGTSVLKTCVKAKRTARNAALTRRRPASSSPAQGRRSLGWTGARA